MPTRLFDATVLPHLDAAFNFARWLTRNDAEAEDVVQDACVRALRHFGSLRDDDARAWLFTIVRNTWYTRVSRRPVVARPGSPDGVYGEPFDEAPDPEAQLLQQDTVARVREAIGRLPAEFREAPVVDFVDADGLIRRQAQRG